MSRIKELLKDGNSILVFDVDGVLALLEFGERTHYEMNDELWKQANELGVNYYTEEKVSKKMQNFLKDKNMNNIYVITTTIVKCISYLIWLYTHSLLSLDHHTTTS